MTRRRDDLRSAIESAPAGTPSTALGASLGVTPARIRALGGGRGKAGRPPSGAITVRTARGAALLARLVADSAAAGVEPERYLDAAASQASALIAR